MCPVSAHGGHPYAGLEKGRPAVIGIIIARAPDVVGEAEDALIKVPMWVRGAWSPIEELLDEVVDATLVGYWRHTPDVDPNVVTPKN